MEHNDNNSHNGHYDEQLLTTNGIKFTHREIDVLSCIFHTRGSSKIASLLSISARTVETHTANIMRKMDTNSREGIIDFIEKHDHSSLITKHYYAILLQIQFKRKLTEINNLIRSTPFHCYIIYDHRLSDEMPFINRLKNDLKICGIQVNLIASNKVKSETFPNHRGPAHIIYLPSQGFLATEESKIRQMLATHAPIALQDNPSWVYVFLPSQAKSEHNNSKNNNFISFDTEQDYELTYFELIRQLLPTINLSEIVVSFTKTQESMIEVPGKDSPKNTLLSKKGILEVLLPIHRAYPLMGFFIVLLCLVGLYILNDSPFSEARVDDLNADLSIRSDLFVPSKNTLLDRPNLMAKIGESLSGNEGIKAVGIVGIGGAGKSTLARRYALQQNFQVIWEINAATRETIMDSFERLAYALCTSEEEKQILQGLQNIKIYAEKDEKILLFVKGKLKTNSKWLLLYDNVEKFTNIRKYFPSDATVWGMGRIIITTSNSNTKNNSLINTFIQIGELSPSQKRQLFKQIMGNEKANPSSQEQEATIFLNDIPPFPLDVSIAAYYLKSTGTPYTKYLERLKEDNKDFETIQADVVKEASGYTKTRYNIITLSLIQLIESHKDFQDLMLMSTLLDYQNIPKMLLASYKGDTVVDNFIYNLKKYSLITSEAYENSIATFSLHKSTQEIILAYLKKSLSLKAQEPLIHSIGDTLENSIIEAIDDEDFSKMKILAPHCEAFLNHDKLLSEPMKSSIGGALGCIYYYLWNKNKAKYLLETNLSNLNHYPTDNHNKIARLLVYLGNFYRSVGNYDQAKKVLERSLTIYKMNPNHLSNARALGFLAAVYRDLGDYKMAKNLLQESLGIHEKYSRNKIGHAWILSKLGTIYMLLGDYKQARSLLENSLLIYKMQGEDYVGVAWVLSHLGTVYEREGDPEKAINLLNQSLTITRKYFYDDHIFVASGLAALGKVYTHNGNFQAAKKTLKESLRVYTKNYGIDHIQTAHVQRVLGEAFMVEGDMETAESLFNMSLLVFQRKIHPEEYMALENLADLYQKKSAQALSDGYHKQSQSFNTQAKNYLNQALKILEDSFESDSPHIAKIKSKLSDFNEFGEKAVNS